MIRMTPYLKSCNVYFPYGVLKANETNYNKCPCIPDRIGIWKCWFLWGGENRRTRRKTSQSRETTNNKLYPHRTLCKTAAEVNLELPGTNPYS